MKIKIAFFAVISAVSLCAHAQDSAIKSIDNIEKLEANPANFTVKAYVQSLFDKSALGNSYGAVVTFEKGARTYWHSHPTGQVLIVTAGEGYVQNKDGNLQPIKAGDVVICKNDTLHWHGAAADSAMTHIAISEVDDQRKVTWGEEVKAIEE